MVLDVDQRRLARDEDVVGQSGVVCESHDDEERSDDLFIPTVSNGVQGKKKGRVQTWTWARIGKKMFAT